MRDETSPSQQRSSSYRPNPCIVLPTGSPLETDRMLGKWAIVQWMFLPNGVQRMFTSQHKSFQEKHSEWQIHLQSHLQRVFSSVLSESFITILPIEKLLRAPESVSVGFKGVEGHKQIFFFHVQTSGISS